MNHYFSISGLYLNDACEIVYSPSDYHEISCVPLHFGGVTLVFNIQGHMCNCVGLESHEDLSIIKKGFLAPKQ